MRQIINRISFVCVLAVMAVGASMTPAAAAQGTVDESGSVTDFDIRGQRQETMQFDALEARGVKFPAGQMRALELLRAESEGELNVRWSPLTASPNRISRPGQALTAPNGAPAQTIAETFLNKYSSLWNMTARDMSNMRYSRDVKTRHNGVTHMTLQQQVNGIDVFGGEIIINIDAQGRILNVSGEPVAGARARAQRSAKVSDSDPMDSAAVAVGVDEPVPFGSRVKVYFPEGAGGLRLAWRFIFEDADSPDMYDAIVDAADGTVLWLKNLTLYDHFPAHGDVFTSDSPIPDTPDGAAVSVVRQDVPFSGGDFFPHDDVHFDWWNGGPRTTTTSNNVDAYADRDGNNVADAGSRPVALAGEDFSFALDLTQDPSTYQPAAVANLFYWNNRLHDFFYVLGFDEASGNFQTNNLGFGGAGGDAVRAEAQDNRDGSPPSLCNANMGTPGDGSPPRMQMFQCGSAPERDGDLDNVVIGHEYTHGVHSRLVSTSGNQRGNEGWSDYFGLSLVAEAGDPYGGAYGVGDYLFSRNGQGIRSDPYSTDPAIYRRTFADINDVASCQVRTCSDDPTETCNRSSDCSGNPPAVCQSQSCSFHEDCEPPNTVISQGPCRSPVHRTGELWANALWTSRFNLIGRWGFETGQQTMNQLVIDGMKLSPAGPTFLDGRDAILLADLVNNGGVNQCLIWDGFARMGMGFSAATTGTLDINPIEAFNLPSGCRPDIQVSVDDFGDVGDACVGSTESAALEVCNVGDGFLVVGSVASSNAQFSVTPPGGGYPLVLSPSSCQDLQIVSDPSSTGTQAATLTVSSNDPVDPSTAVMVSGNGTEQDITVTGSTDFGAVSAWSPGEKTVSVCNTGHCDLAVTAASLSCTDFTIVSNPFPATVGQGSCIELVVRFTPTSQGPKSCQLAINSDDPDTPVVNRTLTARTPPFFSLHAGSIEPHGSLGAVVKNGSIFNLDFVYPFTPSLAWDIRLGTGKFDGRPGLSDIEVAKLGANIKFTVNPAAPVRFFLNGGLDLYHFEPGDFEAGANVGLGLNVPAGQRFAFEATYNFNSAFTASPSPEFSEFQLGFLVSF